MERVTLGIMLFVILFFLVRNFGAQIDDAFDRVISLFMPIIALSVAIGCAWYFWPGKEIGEYIAAAVGVVAIPAIVFCIRQYNALNREIEKSKKGA